MGVAHLYLSKCEPVMTFLHYLLFAIHIGLQAREINTHRSSNMLLLRIHITKQFPRSAIHIQCYALQWQPETPLRSICVINNLIITYIGRKWRYENVWSIFASAWSVYVSGTALWTSMKLLISSLSLSHFELIKNEELSLMCPHDQYPLFHTSHTYTILLSRSRADTSRRLISRCSFYMMKMWWKAGQ